jgi:hypothetical protein
LRTIERGSFRCEIDPGSIVRSRSTVWEIDPGSIVSGSIV